MATQRLTGTFDTASFFTQALAFGAFPFLTDRP